MRRPGKSPAKLALATSWRQWVDIVELFALRRPARRWVDAIEYRMLHKNLIQQCGSMAASADVVEAAFYHYLENLAQPWLSPSVLARADHEILMDLLVRCRQADHQLGGRRWARLVPRWAPSALVMVLVLFSLLWGLIIMHYLGYSALQRLRDFSDDIWIVIKRSNDVERLAFLGFVLLVVSMVAISRTAKS